MIDEGNALFGKSSLRIHTLYKPDTDYRALTNAGNLTGPPVIVPPGIYTCSFYAKGTRAGQRVNVWISHFSTGSMYAGLAHLTVSPGKDWRRYHFTFETKVSMPVNLNINADSPDGTGYVWLDGLQLESGSQATPFETKPVEGRLLTSAPDNFISAKEKINAKMKLVTIPGAKGKAVVKVKNFYNEEILRTELTFTADHTGSAVISLPFDGKLGKGIFVIRTDYELADGRKSFDFHRLTVCDFLENKHALKNFFAEDYGHLEQRYNLLDYLERYRKVGLGAKNHLFNWSKIVSDTYRSYGVEPTDSSVGTLISDPDTRKLIGFGILPTGSVGYGKFPDDPEYLIRDFKLDAGGVLTDAYLAKLTEAAKTVAKAHPWIKLWCFYGEIKAKFPDEWWSKDASPEATVKVFARLLKACADGVRQGNPQAKVYQDAPCNMNPGGGIAETELLLKECNRIGVKFDVIGIHPYRFSPENPDLDADIRTFLAMLDRNGYKDTPVFFPEMMHWGAYNIPQWGTESSSWQGTPRSWHNGAISYDMGWTEKLSAAWRARSWLMALKYSDRIFSVQSGAMNNFDMDLYLTPFASQIVSNTLGNLLGNSRFRKEVRFAPFIRCYIFEDERKRPVAALWCHQERVDSGKVDAPVAEADFGAALEGAFDLMNHPRAVPQGKITFPVTSFPLFLRGKPGTLADMIKALENASLVSGDGITPVLVSSRPVSPAEMKITVENLVSRDLAGTLNGHGITVKGSSSGSLSLPLPITLKDTEITHQQIPVEFKTGQSQFKADSSFDGFCCRKVKDGLTLSEIDWAKLPAVTFTKYTGKQKETDGSFRMAWNTQGLFLEVNVKDRKFVHEEYPRMAERWNNDCLQVYIDTFADARSKQKQGYDENDYEYGIFPNHAGTSACVYRAHLVDQQLGLGTAAPQKNTVAEDIPSTFTRNADGYTYRVFFPAKYLLPARMQKGYVMGFGLFAPNVDDPAAKKEKRMTSALTLDEDSKGCFNRPHKWPLLLLWE